MPVVSLGAAGFGEFGEVVGKMRAVTNSRFNITLTFTAHIYVFLHLTFYIACFIRLYSGVWYLTFWCSRCGRVIATRCSAITESPRCRVGPYVIVFAKSIEDWNWETIFYGHYRSIFNHCDIIGLKICRIRWKNEKIRAITAFKVIQGHRGRYQSKARMQFPISD